MTKRETDAIKAMSIYVVTKNSKNRETTFEISQCDTVSEVLDILNQDQQMELIKLLPPELKERA